MNKQTLIGGLEAIIQGIDIGITLQDRRGNVIYANQAAAAMLGRKSVLEIMQTPRNALWTDYSLFDTQGKLMSPSRLPGRLVLKGKPAAHQVIRYVNRVTKMERWADIDAVPIYDDDGEIEFVVNTLKDINELKIEEQKRDQFLAIASHELKTPLTTIKALNQTVLKNYTNHKHNNITEYLKKIDTKVNELTYIINEFLDMNKAKSQKLDVIPDLTDLNQLVHDTVDDLQSIIKTHQITVKGFIDRPIYIDRARVGLVVSNLIRNAYKYSPEETEIIIHLTSYRKKVKVCVQDFGVGIPLEEQQNIFEAFYQSEGVRDRYVSGLGLGLYIAAEIVKLHGGKIWVHSVQGKGSTFCFTLLTTPQTEPKTQRVMYA